MNFALIALVIVAVVAAVCALAAANLKTQQRAVDSAWQRMEALRREGLHALPAFVFAVSHDEAAARSAATPSRPSALRRALADVERAAAAAAQADGARAAAVADDQLVQAVERAYAATEVDASFVAGAASRQTSAALDAAEQALAHEQRLYNNAAAIYANAQRTFPALLFTRRLGLAEPERYESEAAARRAALDWSRAGLPSLADASPHVMNPQLLWASSMADYLLDDRTDGRRR